MSQCAQCSSEIGPGPLGRMPPWCPKCGVDLKIALGQAPAAVSAPQPATEPARPEPAKPAPAEKPPEPSLVSIPQRDESLQELIARVSRSQQDDKQALRRNRGTALQALCLGVLLLGAGLGLAWLSLEWSEGRRVVLSAGCVILGLILSIAGVHGLITGRSPILKDDHDKFDSRSF